MQPRKKAAIAWSVLQKCVRSELWFSFFQSTKKALFSANAVHLSEVSGIFV